MGTNHIWWDWHYIDYSIVNRYDKGDMVMTDQEHAINQAFEAMLDRAWEEYNEEGPEEEYDMYTQGDAMYDAYRDMELQYE